MLAEVARTLRPGGLFLFDTINRNPLSRFVTVTMAEDVLRILPRGLRNWLYRRFARNRYRLFGRADMCALPDPAFQRRLLR